MTCIVGVAQDGGVTIGGDSASVGGWDLTISNVPKVWAENGWAFGFTSSWRMGQLLRWSFTPPPIEEGPLERYMATTFIDGVRRCLKDGGYAKVESNREEGGDFLVGHAGRLFSVAADFQVMEPAGGLAAVGCGHAFALGAMRALPRQPAKSRVRRALEIAADSSAGVAGPFTIVNIGRAA